MISINRFLKTKRGSTLIWALVVMLILSLVLMAVLSMSSQSLTRAADTHVKDQSYYTAFSVARRVAEWLVGDGSNPNPTTANPDTRFDLIKAIDVDNPPKNPAGVFTFPFEEGNLGDGLGRCDITLKYVDSRKKIDITVDATYQDKNTVVTATIKTPSPGIAGMVADGSGVDAPSQVKVGPLTEKEAGLYKIEVWGAAGGNGREKTPAGSAEKQGGRGGYASGEVYLPKDTVLWLNAGGIGQKSVGGATTLTPGGFNGGGSITTPTGKAEGMGASGGGASDVRAIPLGDDPDTNPELTRRIIVAGGGGGGAAGASNSYGSGGSGGGLSGGGQAQRGGTQTAGGTGGGTAAGSFGIGGDAPSAGTTDGNTNGAGGGGWYGGAAGKPGNNTTAGGGGSGFVLTDTPDTATSIGLVPGGYFGGGDYASYYFTNVKNLSGDQLMPSFNSGGEMRGNSGAGYVRITLVEEKPFTMPPTNITPNVGPTTGGQNITVSGKDFMKPGNSIPGGGNTGSYDYVQDNLIVWLDALNKDGLGDGVRSTNSADANIWKNLVSGGVDFNLTNVTDNFRSLSLNGIPNAASGSRIISAANLDLTWYDSLTVEITFKPEDNTSGTNSVGMLFESGIGAGANNGWNNNIGGFGAVYNTTSSGSYTGGIVHTNYNAAAGNASFAANYAWNNESVFQTHTNIYTIVADPDGRQVYIDGVKLGLIPTSSSIGTLSGATPGGGTFGAGLPFRIGSRNDTQLKVKGEICSVRIYGKKLSQAEVTHNFETDNYRFINPPRVTLGDADCAYVVVKDDTTITCVTPTHTAGLVDNVIYTLGTQKALTKKAYMYVDPNSDRFELKTIKSKDTQDATGSTDGGELITITGKGFRYFLPGYTPHDWVTDGLILHWNGVNNTNSGYSETGHSDSATTWTDLSGTGNTTTILGTDPIENHWDWNAFYMGSSPAEDQSRYINMTAIKKPTGSNLNNVTTEVVYQPPQDSERQINSPFVYKNGTNTYGPRTAHHIIDADKDGIPEVDYWSDDFWVSRNGSTASVDATKSTPPFVAPVGGVIQSRTYFNNITTPAVAGFAPGKTVYVMANGEGFWPGSMYALDTLSTTMAQGILAPTSFHLAYPQTSDGYQRNRYFDVRIYNRILTGAEVQQNRLADEDRVLGLLPISVTFGGVAATDMQVLDDETITCRLPSRTLGGTVDVAVNLYGKTETLTFNYKFNDKKAIKYRMGA